ncbi:homeobox-leucine zipper protein ANTHOCYANINLESS [Trifolium repens]|nr:homeobox-leucine zipper protein ANTHOCYANINLESS [Trifolium repens]
MVMKKEVKENLIICDSCEEKQLRVENGQLKKQLAQVYALGVIDELIQMAEPDSDLWIKTEATRETVLLCMNVAALIETFMDAVIAVVVSHVSNEKDVPIAIRRRTNSIPEITWVDQCQYDESVVQQTYRTMVPEMGCNSPEALGSVNGGGDVWINDNRFRILRQLGEGGFAFVYLVKEAPNDSATGGLANKLKDSSHLSDDGSYAMKKVLIQNNEQLEWSERRYASRHCLVTPISSHFLIMQSFLLRKCSFCWQPTLETSWSHEAYLLFPVHLDGTLLDNAKTMKAKKEHYSTSDVLQIFRFNPVKSTQQLCAGLKHMHNLDPPYAHNDVKPGSVLLTHRKGQSPLAILMDFGSARPARRHISSRSEALQLQEWASEHCSAPFRSPELWDCPSHADIDERTDIWSLGCTLYAIMYQKKKKKTGYHFGFNMQPTWNPHVFLIKKYPKILSTSVLTRTRRGIPTFHYGWRPDVESLYLQRQLSLRRIWNQRGMWFSPVVESPICTSDIATGGLGNSVFIISADNRALQDSWTDSSSSMNVYSPINMQSLNLVMSGGDSSFVALLPSGFSILPDGYSSNNSNGTSSDGSSSSGSDNVGCLLTFGLKMLLYNHPSSKLTTESIDTVNNHIATTIQKVKDVIGVA